MWLLTVFTVAGMLSTGFSESEDNMFPEQVMSVQRNVSETGKEIAEGVNKFALQLYKVLGKEEGNLFFSPLSVSSNLAMLYFMTAGETGEELSKALHLPEGEEKIGTGFSDVMNTVSQNGTLAMANKAFIDESLTVKPSYLDVISKYLKSEAANVNYADTEEATSIINSWTKEHTGGKIPELLRQGTLDTNTRMVLVSTVHFKGLWHYKFDDKLTEERDFQLADGTTTKVPMMKGKSQFGYRELGDLHAKILHLPYKRGLQMLTIVLPEKPDGLPHLEKELEKLDFDKEVLNTNFMTEVSVLIPKFRLELSIKLTDYLKELGIRKVFGEGETDFSNGVEGKGLYLGLVQHSACIEVDEQGTEAAAATASVISMRSGFSMFKNYEFVADRPFLFFITDRTTNTILFAGRYTLPVK